MANTISKEAVFDIVQQHIREVLPDIAQHDLKRSDSLRELGANSIDRADIIMEVMATLSLNIARIELLGAQNIGELVELIYAKL